MLRRKPSILIIEDNPADRELIRRSLRDRGVEVSLVDNGREALFYFSGKNDRPGRPPPDLIIVDLNMPMVDGKEFIREFRSEITHSSVPIVVFSSSDNVSDIAASYSAGATSYIVKPVDLQPFRECLDTVVNYWLDLSAPWHTGSRRRGEQPA